MPTGNCLISVRDLCKTYNGGTLHALSGVSLDIYQGDVVVLIGPSGSGKSTLLRSLNLLETPDSGSILFDGVDITKKTFRTPDGKTVRVNIDAHRQKLGMVFQHFNLSRTRQSWKT